MKINELLSSQSMTPTNSGGQWTSVTRKEWRQVKVPINGYKPLTLEDLKQFTEKCAVFFRDKSFLEKNSLNNQWVKYVFGNCLGKNMDAEEFKLQQKYFFDSYKYTTDNLKPAHFFENPVPIKTKYKIELQEGDPISLKKSIKYLEA